MKYILALLLLSISPMLSARFATSSRSKKAVEIQTPVLQKEMQGKGFNLGNELFLRLIKTEQVLEVWVKKEAAFKLFKTYKICYFSGGLGSKQKKGDGKSPEGFYGTTPKSLNPHSAFHLSFDTNYPNAYDCANGYTGSAIMIHGNCVSIGCYAMTDPYIEEIYTLVQKAFENGQKEIAIHIFPFRMTDANMKKYATPEWTGFWDNLKTGYDYFETTKILPKVGVKNKKYTFQ